MPTFETSAAFESDFKALSPSQKREFRRAVGKFVEDLEGGHGFRAGLRVKGVRKDPGVFELTWAPDGGAIFSYGEPVRGADPHVIWHAVGTHDVLP